MEHKGITHIDCPKEWESENDYDSHRGLLWLVLANNKEAQPIAEFGSGLGSTKLLREYCESHGMKFESFETEDEWAKSTGAKIVDTYKNVILPMGYILFVDGKPGEERTDLVSANKDKHIIILHDTEPGAQSIYGITEVLNSFKYRLDYYPEGKPGTTALSNFIDVTQWA